MPTNGCEKLICTQDAVRSQSVMWIRTVGASCGREVRHTIYTNSDCSTYERYTELNGTPVAGVAGVDFTASEPPQATVLCNPPAPPPPPPSHVLNGGGAPVVIGPGNQVLAPSGNDGYTVTPFDPVAFCAAVNACVAPLTPLTLQEVLGTLPAFLGASGSGDDSLTFAYSPAAFTAAVQAEIPDQTATGTFPSWLPVSGGGKNNVVGGFNAAAFCAAVNACVAPLTPLTLQQVLGTLPTWMGASGAGDDVITFAYSDAAFTTAVHEKVAIVPAAATCAAPDTLIGIQGGTAQQFSFPQVQSKINGETGLYGVTGGTGAAYITPAVSCPTLEQNFFVTTHAASLDNATMASPSGIILPLWNTRTGEAIRAGEMVADAGYHVTFGGGKWWVDGSGLKTKFARVDATTYPNIANASGTYNQVPDLIQTINTSRQTVLHVTADVVMATESNSPGVGELWQYLIIEVDGVQVCSYQQLSETKPAITTNSRSASLTTSLSVAAGIHTIRVMVFTLNAAQPNIYAWNYRQINSHWED